MKQKNLNEGFNDSFDDNETDYTEVFDNEDLINRIKVWLNKHLICRSGGFDQHIEKPNFKINADMTIDVKNVFCYVGGMKDGKVVVYTYKNGDDAYRLEDNKLPDYIQFNEANNFYVSNLKLTTLRGCPKIVHGDFSCAGNDLENFEGGPEEVFGRYLFTFGTESQPVKSWKGMAHTVGSLDLIDYNITEDNLQYFPNRISSMSGYQIARNWDPFVKKLKEEYFNPAHERWMNEVQNKLTGLVTESFDDSFSDDENNYTDIADSNDQRLIQIENIKKWMAENTTNRYNDPVCYKINDDLTIDVLRDKHGFDTGILIRRDSNKFDTYEFGDFPPYINFNIVHGTFDCSWNRLTTLRGCPKRIVGIGADFYCYHNDLHDLKYGPEYVEGLYKCDSNPLENIEDISKNHPRYRWTEDYQVPEEFQKDLLRILHNPGDNEIYQSYIKRGYTPEEIKEMGLDYLKENFDDSFDDNPDDYIDVTNNDDTEARREHILHMADNWLNRYASSEVSHPEWNCAYELEYDPENDCANVNVDSDIIIFNCPDEELPAYINFKHCSNDFIASKKLNNSFTSLRGFPEHVYGDFYISGLDIENLVGGPDVVYGTYNVDDCEKLKSFEGAPSRVGGSFKATQTGIETLNYLPGSIGWNFYLCLSKNLPLSELKKLSRLELSNDKEQSHMIAAGPGTGTGEDDIFWTEKDLKKAKKLYKHLTESFDNSFNDNAEDYTDTMDVSELEEYKEFVKNWIHRHIRIIDCNANLYIPSYTINKDWTIDLDDPRCAKEREREWYYEFGTWDPEIGKSVEGYSHANTDEPLTKIPDNIQFNFANAGLELEGWDALNLTTLKGMPRTVYGWFNCSYNSLKNMKYCPKSCAGIDMNGNDFQSVNDIVPYLPEAKDFIDIQRPIDKGKHINVVCYTDSDWTEEDINYLREVLDKKWNKRINLYMDYGGDDNYDWNKPETWRINESFDDSFDDNDIDNYADTMDLADRDVMKSKIIAWMEQYICVLYDSRTSSKYSNDPAKYVLNDDGTIDILESAYIRDWNADTALTCFPDYIQIHKVCGDFDISDSAIEYLSGPEIVEGQFDCSRTMIDSLSGGPVEVMSYITDGNNFHTIDSILSGLPRFVPYNNPTSEMTFECTDLNWTRRDEKELFDIIKQRTEGQINIYLDYNSYSPNEESHHISNVYEDFSNSFNDDEDDYTDIMSDSDKAAKIEMIHKWIENHCRTMEHPGNWGDPKKYNLYPEDYRINDDYSIDVFTNRFHIFLNESGMMPDYIQFNKTKTIIIAPRVVKADTERISLRGCPRIVNGTFEIGANERHPIIISDLTNGPEYVKGDYICEYCGLTSIKGIATYIGGDFKGSHNHLSVAGWEELSDILSNVKCNGKIELMENPENPYNTSAIKNLSRVGHIIAK